MNCLTFNICFPSYGNFVDGLACGLVDIFLAQLRSFFSKFNKYIDSILDRALGIAPKICLKIYIDMY